MYVCMYVYLYIYTSRRVKKKTHIAKEERNVLVSVKECHVKYLKKNTHVAKGERLQEPARARPCRYGGGTYETFPWRILRSMPSQGGGVVCAFACVCVCVCCLGG